MLVISGAFGWERVGVGELGAAVRVVGNLVVVLDLGPDFFVQERQVPAVLALVAEGLDVLGHVFHGAVDPPPHAPVQGPLVVRVVADRVHPFPAADPVFHRETLAHVQPAVGIPHDVPRQE